MSADRSFVELNRAATERLRAGENADVSARDALVGHGRSFLFVCLAGNITRMNICSVIRP